MDASPILLVLNQAGLAAAELIARRFSTARIHGLAGRVPTADTQFNETIDHIRLLFQAGHPIVGFCASGMLGCGSPLRPSVSFSSSTLSFRPPSPIEAPP